MEFRHKKFLFNKLFVLKVVVFGKINFSFKCRFFAAKLRSGAPDALFAPGDRKFYSPEFGIVPYSLYIWTAFAQIDPKTHIPNFE